MEEMDRHRRQVASGKCRSSPLTPVPGREKPPPRFANCGFNIGAPRNPRTANSPAASINRRRVENQFQRRERRRFRRSIGAPRAGAIRSAPFGSKFRPPKVSAENALEPYASLNGSLRWATPTKVRFQERQYRLESAPAWRLESRGKNSSERKPTNDVLLVDQCPNGPFWG